jgi:hypothetical protein
MNTYILFVFGTFEDHDDIEYFCLDVLGDSPKINSIKYVIENNKNIIIIFESDIDIPNLEEEIHPLLNNDNVNFYFMFEKEGLVLSYIPQSVKDLIFKPKSDITEIIIEDDIIQNNKLDLDELLDKIKKRGVESLTKEEKKFLDNFEN